MSYAMPGYARANLERIFRAGLAAVDARAAVESSLTLSEKGFRVAGWDCASDTKLVVIAVGKAAAAMAEAVGALVPERIRVGLVVTKDGHAEGRALDGFEVLETSHPVPDERCAQAGRRALQLAADARENELLLVLLSGGASSLVSLPSAGIRVDDLARTNEVLLGCGADISELNAVRKHVSQISGGRLARGTKARRVAVLAVSDVAGDEIDVIGSGPCAPDPTRYEDAFEVLDGYGVLNEVPDSVLLHLQRGIDGVEEETLKPGDPTFARVRHEIVANNRVARIAAMKEARLLGAQAVSLGECVHGEARTVGARLAAIAAAVESGQPVCLIAGGESVVHLTGRGRGGRNQELALSAAIAISDRSDCDVVLLAAGTDGSDGPTRAAGGWADSGTVARGLGNGSDAYVALADNDSNAFFEAEGGLFVTGPTGTNVMDLVLVWVSPKNGKRDDE